MLRAPLLLLALSVLLGVLAPAADASIRAAGPDACIMVDEYKGCQRFTPRAPAGDPDESDQGMAVSPDGRHAYYVDGGRTKTGRGRVVQSSSLFVLALDHTAGRITQVRGRGSCLTSVARRGCAGVRGMDHAYSLAISPDGRFVMTSSYRSGGVAIFRRDAASGRLTQLAGREGCLRSRPKYGRATERCRYLQARLRGDGIQVAPNGRLAYVGGVAFTRDPATGRMRPSDPTLPQATGRRPPESLRPVGGGVGLHFTPDTRLAVAVEGNALVVYAVDQATGKLTVRSCTAIEPKYGCRRQGDGPNGTTTLSPDGRFLHLSLEEQIVTYALDAATGTLTRSGTQIDLCRRPDGTPHAACEGADRLLVPPTGDRLLAMSSLGAFELTRDPATGGLSPSAPDSCLKASYVADSAGTCATAAAYDTPYGAVASADGRTVTLFRDGGVGLLRLG